MLGGKGAPVTEHVYLIGSPGSSTAKIGRSKDPEKRLAGFQTGCPLPLSVLATHPGSHELETALHRHFAEHRLHGEWFDLGEDPVEAFRAAISLGDGLFRPRPRKELEVPRHVSQEPVYYVEAEPGYDGPRIIHFPDYETGETHPVIVPPGFKWSTGPPPWKEIAATPDGRIPVFSATESDSVAGSSDTSSGGG
ncbi:GIY-YIG nuclease family protein (plasmid) [Streptomyces sp. NBC_01525]